MFWKYQLAVWLSMQNLYSHFAKVTRKCECFGRIVEPWFICQSSYILYINIHLKKKCWFENWIFKNFFLYIYRSQTDYSLTYILVFLVNFSFSIFWEKKITLKSSASKLKLKWFLIQDGCHYYWQKLQMAKKRISWNFSMKFRSQIES